jgi:hypothetical protein
MNEILTVNRVWLKRQVIAGLIEAKCNYHFTDDYAYDNASGFGKTTWLPARVSHPTYKDVGELGHERNILDDHDFIEGFMNFTEWDFKTKSGAAWWDNETEINFIIHSNHSFTMRFKT